MSAEPWPTTEAQMSTALHRMAQHRGESMRIDRRGWTDEQWVEDARRLMDDLDGSISSLVNGHVLALLRCADRIERGES